MFYSVDLESWARKDCFQNFLEPDCSCSITQQLCITPFYACLKERGLRFYPAFT